MERGFIISRSKFQSALRLLSMKRADVSMLYYVGEGGVSVNQYDVQSASAVAMVHCDLTGKIHDEAVHGAPFSFAVGNVNRFQELIEGLESKVLRVTVKENLVHVTGLYNDTKSYEKVLLSSDVPVAQDASDKFSWDEELSTLTTPEKTVMKFVTTYDVGPAFFTNIAKELSRLNTVSLDFTFGAESLRVYMYSAAMQSQNVDVACDLELPCMAEGKTDHLPQKVTTRLQIVGSMFSLIPGVGSCYLSVSEDGKALYINFEGDGRLKGMSAKVFLSLE